ncbi:BglG family transcription antiterminator [Clostridium brassicae]|uniref:BglG family transcription antiterminator n=1 Tax=Clostridium brassicae TaxID=2999072 RepID=A0ABT4D7I2_9CLOT|nr:BglG family transcription antiterminator [Clostridium brassicae]MCY6958118.1 BglG family transcription antiterminator [Clostridium brassicae]
MRGITKRQKEILTRIINSTGYSSPKELANKLEVSTRTIRNDILEINSYNTVQVVSMIKSKGYYIKEHELAKKMLEEYSDDIPITVEERTSYIINKLLYRMDSIDIFDLADELMVSEYTIEKDLNKVKLLFKNENNNIEMKRVSNKIFVEATEKEKRSLLCKLILKEQKDNVFDIDSYAKNFKNIDIREINNILRSYFLETDIKINDLAIINLVVHILIVLEKVRNNFDIKDDNNYLSMLDNEDIKISNDICERIEKLINITIPKREKEYIALLISGKRIFIHNRSNIEKNNEKVTNFINHIVDKLYKEYLFNFKDDMELISGLSLHMENLLIRSKKGIFIQNPLIYTIKKVYPLIYDMGVSISLEYEETFGYRLNDDEIGLIVLHLASSIEKLNEENFRIRCYVICPTGVSSSNLLKNRLMKVYPDKLNVVGCLSIQELDDEKVKAVDLIISTVPIEKTLKVKTIECSPFLLKDDINKLNKTLDSLMNKEEYNEISKLFDKDLFYKDIELEDRMDIIEYLAEELYIKGYCPKDYVEYVLKREKASSTAYGGLIAIPHPLEKVAYNNKIEIGILKEPIMWGKYKVQVVFLFCLNSDKNLNLDAFFERLIFLVENQDVMKKLINSKNYEEFVNIFIADYN